MDTWLVPSGSGKAVGFVEILGPPLLFLSFELPNV
jgi:hypothetical protein